MTITLHDESGWERIGARIHRRPNSARVLRLLRELVGIDDRWSDGMDRIGFVPALLAGVLVLGLLLAFIGGRIVVAHGSTLSAFSEETVSVASPDMTPQEEQAQYQAWVRQAHARTAARAEDAPLPTTF